MGGPCFYCTDKTGRKLGCHDKCSKYQTYKNRLKKHDRNDNDFYEYTEQAIKRMGSEGRRA